MKPKLLDAFCCEGGASMGYSRAGFDVYGIDLFVDYSLKRYPFPAWQGDALDAFRRLLAGEALAFVHLDGTVEMLGLEDFAAVHTSPPCQHATIATSARRKNDGAEYPALIPPTRAFLEASGKPWVIENVKGADLRDPLELCGCMFSIYAFDDDGELLRLERRRLFESNVRLEAPGQGMHGRHYHPADIPVGGSYGGSRKQGDTPAERRHNAKHLRKGGYVPSKQVQQKLLGIDWMTVAGMYQSLPPIYTIWIGFQLLEAIHEQKQVAA